MNQSSVHILHLLRRIILSRFFSCKFIEEWMFECVFDGDTVRGINRDHLAYKIKAFRAEIIEVSIRISWLEARVGWFEVGTLLERRPSWLVGRTMKLENLEDLIDFWVAHEECTLFNHLVKDAAETPNVHSETIRLLTKQNFGRSIPERLDFMSECFDGHAERAS